MDAINNLKEPGGSKKDSIAAYIAVIYIVDFVLVSAIYPGYIYCTTSDYSVGALVF